MSEYTCRGCGGEMIGDGYTAALHCENVDMPTGVEAAMAAVESRIEAGTLRDYEVDWCGDVIPETGSFGVDWDNWEGGNEDG